MLRLVFLVEENLAPLEVFRGDGDLMFPRPVALRFCLHVCFFFTMTGPNLVCRTRAFTATVFFYEKTLLLSTGGS